MKQFEKPIISLLRPILSLIAHIISLFLFVGKTLRKVRELRVSETVISMKGGKW